MSENKAKLSDSLKKNVTPKNFKKNPIKGTKFTIMVSSAKGGVGKSTFAINLTFALQKKGKKVGLLDADIHGPSLPKMIGLNDKPKTDGKFLFPLEKYGAQFMSLGFLVDEKTPMIWRGPMVISAIKTLTEKVAWKDLDYLVVDMPPGTGDTQLTFAQDVKIDGAIIVSTPQELALMDVQRGIQMFDKTKIRIVGLVDNMSFFESDDGKKYNIFGEGGVEKTAKEFNKNFLGKIPISIKLRESADLGLPLTYKEPDHEISKLFIEIANKILEALKLGPDRITFVEDRPGHDFRYAVNFDELKKIGFTPVKNLDDEISKIVEWYEENKSWWEKDYLNVLENRLLRTKLN